MNELDGSVSSNERAEMDTDLGYFSFQGSSEFVSKQTDRLLTILEKLSLEMIGDGLAKEEDNIENPTQETLIKDQLLLSIEQADELANFLAETGINSHQERYAAILCWLEGNKNVNEISSSELEEIYSQLRIPPPQHPSQIFWDAKSRKGWFDSAEQEGYYRLSSKGKHFVEHNLLSKE